MARYIDADRLINEISGNGGVFTYGPKVVMAIVSRINLQPTADVVEVKHGEWIKVGYTESRSNILQCSQCKRIRRGRPKSPYCPDCGAKMDGDKEGEKL